MEKPKKPPNTWPKVWKLSKKVTAELYETGVLAIDMPILTKAEVRRLYQKLSGLYRD